MEFPRSWYDHPDSPYRMIRGGIVFTFFGLCAVTLMTCLVWFGTSMDARNCKYAGRQYGLHSHYHFLDDCYVRLPSGQSISIDQYRAVEKAK